MGKAAAILRILMFCVFFSCGTISIALSILSVEIADNISSRNNLSLLQHSNGILEKLNEEYQFQLEEAENNPEKLEKIKNALLGILPEDANTLFPRATDDLLAAADAVLDSQQHIYPDTIKIPLWLDRAQRKNIRIGLFFCGSVLVLISFGCFCPNVIKPRSK